jgi:anti-anti-sigma factor
MSLSPCILARNGRVLSISFRTGALNDSVAGMLGEFLVRAVAECGAGRLEMDFANVDDLSSIAIAKLLACYRRVKTAGGELVLTNVSRPLFDVFQAVGVSRLFEVRPAEDASTAVA